jgi:hypothetical protein
MRDDQEFEALLRDALSRSGEPAPFPVDVTRRVMARVAELGPPPAAEMSRHQFRRWAVAASIAGAALTLAAIWNAPSLGAALAFALHTMADGTDAVLKLTGPVSSLAGALGRVAMALVTSGQTLVRPLTPFQPFAHAMLAAIAAVMFSITTFVLARDLAGRAADKERA